MSKAYWDSFLKTMGLIAIFYLVLSLVLRDGNQIRYFYLMTYITVLTHFFSFFTFRLKLFSGHIWVRRMIVSIFDAAVMMLMSILFGYFHIDNKKHLLTYGVAAVFIIVFCCFSFYLSDKIVKQNLERINQKLADEAEGDME